MPSKDRRRREAQRLRQRAILQTPDATVAPGGPGTHGLQNFELDQEPTTSTAIRVPFQQQCSVVHAFVGTSAMELDEEDSQSSDEDVAGPSTKRPRVCAAGAVTPTTSRESVAESSAPQADVVRGYEVVTRISERRKKMEGIHLRLLDDRMQKVVRDFVSREWPKNSVVMHRRRSSTDAIVTRCGSGCDCTSSVKCQQNAMAFLAATKYVEQFGHGIVNVAAFKKTSYNDKRGSVTSRCHQNELRCASRSAGHRIDYYDCGQFGEAFCEHCGARLLRAEFESIKRGRRQSPCCSNGTIHTEQMNSELNELQSPPRVYLEGLVDAVDERVREAFLNNTMPFNNLFAFASTHGEKAPPEQMGGRLDTCKYNGQFSFLFSDLIAPGVRRPSFAQVYTLTPEDALNVRQHALDTAVAPNIKRTIMERLEALMRQNPFGQTFQTVGTKIAAARAATGQVPHFRIALLTDRDLKGGPLQGRNDVTVIERADAPTAKQVAVIWVQDDGLPPQISAFWVSDKAGKMRELKSGMPQIDPCCFPMLHPLGTLGWRWYMKKRGSENARPELQQPEEEELYQSSDDELGDEIPIDDIVGTPVNEEEFDEMPEQELELDNDVVEEEQEEPDMNAVGTSTAQPNPRRDEQEDVIFDHEVETRGGRTNISERQFYRYRMALRGSGKNTFHWLWFARRLAEYFTISVLNRIERNELDHLKAIQAKKNYRQIMAREYIAAMEKGVRQQGPNAKLGRVFLMPQTFAGSRQYYQGKYADLMTMVRHLGAPTWFVTFTGNPKWPEIDEALRVRQNYAHRPDIVCRIFMDKAAEFIRDVTERGVLGKVAGWCYSVEHQKRGMPHIHMLLILERGVRIDTAQQVDEYVSARIPTLPPSSDLSPEGHQQRRLWNYVTSMMLHDCNAACLEGSRCRKHFPKPYSDRTELSEVRYTNYVRIPPDESDAFFGRVGGHDIHHDDEHHDPAADPERDWAEVRYQRFPHQGRVPARQHGEHGQTHYKKKRGVRSTILMDDSRVIPYNTFLLLKYGCHINVEYVFGQKACKYIFKYLLKGFEKAYVRVAQPRRSARQGRNDGTAGADEVYDYDEIAATFKVRYMTAMEAYLRLNSYKIVGTSHQVYTLSVHDELGQTIVVEEGHEEEGRWRVRENTRLTAFFALCGRDQEAAQLTYDRIPYRYSWDFRSRSWKKRVRPLEEDPDKAKMFVRVYTVSPRKHELFALRTLLLHRPGPKSFTDLRTVHGIQFDTFVGTCQHMGLQVSDEVFRRAMQEACAEMSNLKRLQHYFAMLLAHAHPSNPQALFDEFLDEMNPPTAANHPGAVPNDVGLKGLPVGYDFQHQAQLLEEDNILDSFYGDDAGQRRKPPQQVAVEQIGRLNPDQRDAFAMISTSILGGCDQKLFFLEGAGGCGKTYFYNTLIKWCIAGNPPLDGNANSQWVRNQELQRDTVVAAASTGIAALLLIGGGTAHRHFYVPNDVSQETPPMLNFESAKADQLRRAQLIIIDEISMLSNTVLDYIDRLLRDVCANASPFGNKVVVLSGDWRQLTPVVEHGTREDQVDTPIKMGTLFRLFQKISLTINMRTAPGEQSLRDWLQEIGNGMHRVGTDSQGFSSQLLIPPELIVDAIDETIQFCFPEALFDDPLANADAIAHNAILCPTNNDVQHINEVALGRMSGCGREFLSIDEPLEPNDEMHNFRTDFNMEAVHNEMPSGMPPHKLTIKVGTPVMLIRNLDVTQGLCNGTRLQVMRTSENNLFCRILTGPRAGAQNIIAIPQIQFEYGRARHHRGLRFRRLQFPVRLCFAMTINKAQGQTLQRMALVLNGRQCFSHGQVYVAMSRVTQMDGIRVYAPFCKSGYETRIENVVYHELLDMDNAAQMPQRTRTPAFGQPDVDNDADVATPDVENDPNVAVPDVGPREPDVEMDTNVAEPDVEIDDENGAGADSLGQNESSHEKGEGAEGPLEAAKRPSEYLKCGRGRGGEGGRGERGPNAPYEAAKRPSEYLKQCDEGPYEAAKRPSEYLKLICTTVPGWPRC
ncbi:hypothetical protein niasHT_014811 [Heterodera trifolii]|uniref:ATP-dependent DNA helicase n=1 Tax=Heterodera trifolii TaxID=157864 RepID=A0ABD2L8T7_9BILA